MADRPLFTARYRVYWSETDAALMMHFSNFFRVCERTEEEFLASLGLSQVGEPGKRIIMPRVRAECNYKSPLRPGDLYRVDIVDIVIGRSSLTYSYRIYNETRGAISAECNIVAVTYDESKGSSVAVPAYLKEKLLSMGARLRSDVAESATA